MIMYEIMTKQWKYQRTLNEKYEICLKEYEENNKYKHTYNQVHKLKQSSSNISSSGLGWDNYSVL